MQQLLKEQGEATKAEIRKVEENSRMNVEALRKRQEELERKLNRPVGESQQKSHVWDFVPEVQRVLGRKTADALCITTSIPVKAFAFVCDGLESSPPAADGATKTKRPRKHMTLLEKTDENTPPIDANKRAAVPLTSSQRANAAPTSFADPITLDARFTAASLEAHGEVDVQHMFMELLRLIKTDDPLRVFHDTKTARRVNTSPNITLRRGQHGHWISVVSVCELEREFGGGSSVLEEAIARTMQRAQAVFEHQKARTFVCALVGDMTSVVSVRIVRDESTDSGVRLESVSERYDLFRPHAEKAGCVQLWKGFFLLRAWLRAAGEDLGFVEPPHTLAATFEDGNEARKVALGDVVDIFASTTGRVMSAVPVSEAEGCERVCVKLFVTDRAPRALGEYRAMRALENDTAAVGLPQLVGVVESCVIDGERFAGIVTRPVMSVPSLEVPAKAIAGVVGRTWAALKHAHGKGVMHGDVKPHNIACSTDGRKSVLIDWDCSVASGTFVELRGTFEFMPLELMRSYLVKYERIPSEATGTVGVEYGPLHDMESLLFTAFYLAARAVDEESALCRCTIRQKDEVAYYELKRAALTTPSMFGCMINEMPSSVDDIKPFLREARRVLYDPYDGDRLAAARDVFNATLKNG